MTNHPVQETIERMEKIRSIYGRDYYSSNWRNMLRLQQLGLILLVRRLFDELQESLKETSNTAEFDFVAITSPSRDSFGEIIESMEQFLRLQEISSASEQRRVILARAKHLLGQMEEVEANRVFIPIKLEGIQQERVLVDTHPVQAIIELTGMSMRIRDDIIMNRRPFVDPILELLGITLLSRRQFERIKESIRDIPDGLELRKFLNPLIYKNSKSDRPDSELYPDWKVSPFWEIHPNWEIISQMKQLLPLQERIQQNASPDTQEDLWQILAWTGILLDLLEHITTEELLVEEEMHARWRGV